MHVHGYVSVELLLFQDGEDLLVFKGHTGWSGGAYMRFFSHEFYHQGLGYRFQPLVACVVCLHSCSPFVLLAAVPVVWPEYVGSALSRFM